MGKCGGEKIGKGGRYRKKINRGLIALGEIRLSSKRTISRTQDQAEVGVNVGTGLKERRGQQTRLACICANPAHTLGLGLHLLVHLQYKGEKGKQKKSKHTITLQVLHASITQTLPIISFRRRAMRQPHQSLTKQEPQQIKENAQKENNDALMTPLTLHNPRQNNQ